MTTQMTKQELAIELNLEDVFELDDILMQMQQDGKGDFDEIINSDDAVIQGKALKQVLKVISDYVKSKDQVLGLLQAAEDEEAAAEVLDLQKVSQDDLQAAAELQSGMSERLFMTLATIESNSGYNMAMALASLKERVYLKTKADQDLAFMQRRVEEAQKETAMMLSLNTDMTEDYAETTRQGLAVSRKVVAAAPGLANFMNRVK